MSPTTTLSKSRRGHRVDDSEEARSVLGDLAAARLAGDARRLAAAQEAVCRQYLDFATSIAHRFRGRGVDHEDVLQVARLGLVKAVRGWKPQPDGGFLQYATPMITGEVRRFFRDHGAMIRMPRTVQQVGPAIVMAREDLAVLGRAATDAEVAAAAGLSEDLVRTDRIARERCAVGSLDAPEAGEDPSIRPADEPVFSVEERILLRQVMLQLTPRERAMIGLRFFSDRTQEQIGSRLGISQMQVSRLLRDTLAKLRNSLQEGAVA